MAPENSGTFPAAARFLLPHDLIRDAEHARLEAKWQLFQARRRGDRSEDSAVHERDVDYDSAIPHWRALLQKPRPSMRGCCRQQMAA